MIFGEHVHRKLAGFSGFPIFSPKLLIMGGVPFDRGWDVPKRRLVAPWHFSRHSPGPPEKTIWQ